VELPAARIPQRECPLPEEVVDAGHAPPLVRGKDDFRVTSRPKLVVAELVSQFDVIEDLAVQDHTRSGAWIAHRLLSAFDVDDREATVPQRHAVQEHSALGLRPAVS
jgi:hypothetical protein